MAVNGERFHQRTNEERLAFIRRENAMWLASEPNAKSWDITFLLAVIDDLLAQFRQKGN